MTNSEKNKKSTKKKPFPTASFDNTVLGPGSQIGQFRIEKELGRGAVGIVYLAHDTKLDRQVAIKSLPEEVVSNPLVKSRFQREARLLAGLNHPNIATIHDEIEEVEGSSFLVLEFIAGETLSERIEKGPLPIEEALSIGQQIAEAVAAAHEQGVIHRDLKPGNIKITPDGKVKVLDFGLAKAVGGEGTDQESTITVPGRVIGTPAYMSPEQARGNPTDHRCDIWSFGCVLFELLTGKIPFKGDTVSDTLANILQSSPEWEKLSENTPSNIKVMIRRCMEKDQQRRLYSMVDAVIEIRETINLPKIAPPVVNAGGGISGPVSKRQLVSVGVVCFVVAAVATGLVAWNWHRNEIKTQIPVVSSSPPWHNTFFTHSKKPLYILGEYVIPTMAISRDGENIVYNVRDGNLSQLFLRRCEQISPEPIEGTKKPALPFFSFDGKWIGYFDEGWLKKRSLETGTVINLAKVPSNYAPWGATWTPNNKIIYTPIGGTNLSIVSDDGSMDEKSLTEIKREEDEQEHQWPHALSDGKTVLFSIWYSGAVEENRIAILSLETWKYELLPPKIKGTRPYYIKPLGQLVYCRGEELLAAPFDPKNPMEIGDPVLILDDIFADGIYHSSQFSISDAGVLIYAPGGIQKAEYDLVWKYPDEEREEVDILKDGPYYSPRVSSDGEKIVYSTVGSDSNIWIKILNQDTLPKKLMKRKIPQELPVFIPPDSKKIAFSTMVNIFTIPVDSDDDERELLLPFGPDDCYFAYPSFAPNSGTIAYCVLKDENASEIWLYNPDDPSNQLFIEMGLSPAFSPDERWVAFVSITDEGKWSNVYIKESLEKLASDNTYPVSIEGGINPFWSHDRNNPTLYYSSIDGKKLMQAIITVDTAGGKPNIDRQEVFSDISNYEFRDVDPNDMRFLGIRKPPPPEITELIIVTDFFNEVKRIIESSDKN